MGDPLTDIVASGRASDLGAAASDPARAVAHAAGAERAFLVPADGSVARVVPAEIRVQDSGGGVPPERQTRLFLPFQKGVNARGGLGVGLAIVCGLAILHGGAVETEASPDAGATFVVRLPLRPVA